jgi:hypothetical protein
MAGDLSGPTSIYEFLFLSFKQQLRAKMYLLAERMLSFNRQRFTLHKNEWKKSLIV